ncbi:hypothetical protein K6119_11255 [Paracrocinitomix mangrovi]|uniref:hypothetical protein n=1 Tax=Paracrocinitomix mangrovi TaxID=2862509 RepID=UPI001C8DC787|nr:hypothetical protein [Paracrocinitomix mangrovi]UKN00311.1 hypothetical protein K6119_11255 [Paracrocinitomix mangrovi]
MYSYKEFPEQVKNAAPKSLSQFGFHLTEEVEDHCLRYKNDKWQISFICDHGAIDVYLVNLFDKNKYYLPKVLQFWFPQSEKAQKFPEFFWGSEKSVNYQVEILAEFYAEFDKKYEDLKNNFRQNKEYNQKIFQFMIKQGSKELKELFENGDPNWKKLALEEMKQNS